MTDSASLFTRHPGNPLLSPELGWQLELGMRTQFDWLPSRVNNAWAANQFRLEFGIVIMARYWD